MSAAQAIAAESSMMAHAARQPHRDGGADDGGKEGDKGLVHQAAAQDVADRQGEAEEKQRQGPADRCGLAVGRAQQLLPDHPLAEL